MSVGTIRQVALAAAVGGVLGFAHRAAVRAQQARRLRAAQPIERTAADDS